MKFILFMNVKMPTIVGILIFINRINDRLLLFKPEIPIDFGYFRKIRSMNFMLSRVEHEKRLITSGPVS